jgi:Ni/Co efflux regulator RcnB
MKKMLVPVCLALAQMMVLSVASAQSSGEADPAQAKAPPSAATTKAERTEARKERRADGAIAARGPQMQEGEVRPTTGPKTTREERKAAAAKRRAANSAAMKAGQLSHGGSGDAPEKQRRP